MTNATRTRKKILGSLMILSLTLFGGISVVSAAPLEETIPPPLAGFPLDSTLLLTLQVLMVACFSLALASYGAQSDPL